MSLVMMRLDQAQIEALYRYVQEARVAEYGDLGIAFCELSDALKDAATDPHRLTENTYQDVL